ncbi:MAG TPA: hypothetical protein VEA80_06645 [Vitreimonas sp.]|uniref:hypothetical protein n=1 Tax=Vitreimonas sp. TaxID=3069702 RepID=UPI002D659FED|nr:hypothetical protein [Vitreimonas sp.]HYD87132.1 hypothetical protein [Vitreimonas sp.]
MKQFEFEETENTITLHGLGFLQVKLGGKQRLHVWHPALPRRACFAHSAIHNHRFGFVSRVLVGEQINHAVAVERNDDATHIAYLHEGARTKFGNRPWIADRRVRVREIDPTRVLPGAEYHMAPYAFHWTEPGGDGRVATLMTKTSEGEHGAHSLCAVGVEPDADFDRKQWSAEALWEIVIEVLGGESAVVLLCDVRK